MWHAAPLHTAAEPRIGVGVRYAPWWMNHLPLLHGSAEREAALAKMTSGKPLISVENHRSRPKL